MTETMRDVDDLDEYQRMLAATAADLIQRDMTAADLIRGNADTKCVAELVLLRTQFLTTEDRRRVAGFLATGGFAEMNGDERVAAFVVCFELDDEINQTGISRRFQRYEREQPLFAQCPELWCDVRKNELVGITNVRPLGRSGLVQLPNSWGRLDPLLPPELLRWVTTEFRDVNTFVRLDPWFSSATKPPEPLLEAAVRPARPGWWSTLALRNREHDGGHYVLQDVEPSAETATPFYEYAVRGVRSLEIHAERDKSGLLSMMLEELTSGRSPPGSMLGRCIHLDTNASPGTDAHDAPLKHLDLAINMYFGETADRRSGMRLCDGKTEPASVRTHLLRVEGVPFSAIAELARGFFRSTVLQAEWWEDQFDGAPRPYDEP